MSGEAGETVDAGLLAITRPWPSMLRGLWGDMERFRETYPPQQVEAEPGGFRHQNLINREFIREEKEFPADPLAEVADRVFEGELPGLHGELGRHPCRPFELGDVEKLLGARPAIEQARLQEHLLDVKRPALGTNPVAIAPADRPGLVAPDDAVEAVPRDRRVDVVVERIAVGDLFPEVALAARAHDQPVDPGGPRHAVEPGLADGRVEARFQGPPEAVEATVLESTRELLAKAQTTVDERIDKGAKPKKTPPKARPRKAKAAKAPAKASKPAKGGAKATDAPIRNYDQLSAKDVVARIQRLSGPQATAVLDYERSRKKRATVIRAVEKRLAVAS